MRGSALALVVVGAMGCAGVMKPDPYAPAAGGIAMGASGVPDVQCAGVPATGPATGFPSVRHRILTRYARPDHRGIDLIATTEGDQIVRGALGYGVTDKAIGGVAVDLFACKGGIWQPIGTATTRANGRFAYALRGAGRLAPGLRDLYASVVGDRSGVRFLAFIAPPGARVVVSDIDGTLTHSETAFIKGIVGAGVGAHHGSAQALQAAAEAGYQVVYLTARGDRFTDETRYWLGTNGFPRGPLRLASSLFVMPGEATVAYKRRALADLAGFQIAAGVGNRRSDVAAYTAAGVPPDRIFVKLPEYKGELGTALREGAAVGFGTYMPLPLP